MSMSCYFPSEPCLAVDYGQGVHPDPPAAILKLDGVVEEHPEEGEDHVANPVLLLRGRVDHC